MVPACVFQLFYGTSGDRAMSGSRAWDEPVGVHGHHSSNRR